MALSEENGNGMVMPVAPLYSQNNGGGGFGFGNGEDGWWIILLFILLGGWGNYGNRGGTGAVDNYVLNSDMAMLERRTDTIINGLCDGFYTQAQLINGVQSQMASCCCDLREAISGVNYNLALGNNQIANTICNSTRDVIDSQNAGTRAILDAIQTQTIEQKNEKIADLERQLQMATLSASQTAQTSMLMADNYAQTQSLINKLNPTPVPAYSVPNPNCCYQSCGCGC